ncbi:YdcF family protein [Aurantimonas aggregata]|uniref:YdcF family protein n=1 Tax=Aurantimonas aggregata TaxID=2047720 RepID=A0A6L9MMN1_9HYPH|nr:YdcF family protein [Aurantimonas aggregata]NDV88728.1 YdcF family protein [Aurantimonas aggregata]
MTSFVPITDSPEQTAPPADGKRRRRPIGVTSIVVLAFVALCGYLAGGFLRFTEEVNLLSRPAAFAAADGIVVLTGGALRIDHAIDLLKEGRGRRLLISGVNPGTSVDALARLTDTDREWFDCCVDIDYAALNTVGNAEIAGRWAREQGFRDLILVTSDYHMPRSLIEFDRVGNIRSVTPYAVRRNDLWRDEQMPSAPGLRVLASEYVKLIAARFLGTIGVVAKESVSTRVAHFKP